jgi:murein DD-endopeptidase MepM/ murein hydrolase activator NlpD
MVLARKKEFMVNEKAAAKHGPLLEAINSNKNSRLNTGYGVGGGIPGIAGLIGGMAGSGFARGAGEAIQVKGEKAIRRARRREARRSANARYQASKAGMYSDRAFSLEQLNNAATIASVGSKMGMSKRDIMIGIMTAITESGLINIHGGDRDSQGLFQQRPSMGWGSVAQVTNPTYAAGAFFRPLKAHGERNSESPWLAAQHIQRSAFSDGSNYRQYWDNAQAIYKSGLNKRKAAGPGGNGAFYAAGTGGWHKPSIPGKGWGNSHDYHNGYHSPLYAYNDGRIIESRAIRTGGSGQNSGAYPRGYSSYGVTMVVQGDDGNKVRYAHGWPGTNMRVGRVKGGTKIMESAATGNASGPHTHFEVNGSEMAQQWFREHGIGLKTGGFVQSPGMANLHDEELVVDKVRTKLLFDGIENLASGGQSQYNVNVNVLNPGASAEEIANRVTVKLKRAEDRKPTRRR